MKYIEVIKKACADPNYKKEFLKDPKAMFQKEGIEIRENVKIFVHENNENEIHLVIPKNLEGEFSDERLFELAGGSEWEEYPRGRSEWDE